MAKNNLILFFLFVAICAAIFVAVTGCGESHYIKFSGDKAFAHLTKQCDFGPRIPNSDAHKNCGDYILNNLKQYADEVREQNFTYNIDGKVLRLRNIIGIFNLAAKDHILLCAHWDSRPFADEELDKEKAMQPVLGANDGASGVAVLLELARIFKNHPPKVGIIMVFFDGEDYGPGPENMFLGSKKFAQTWKQMKLPNGQPLKFRYGILLDMVGDKNLTIYREQYSNQKAPKIVDKVWKAAESLGYSNVFKNEAKYFVNDDHIPLIISGIDCIDIIDFEYAPWHTIEDTPDKCSPDSLKIVGQVVAKVVYDEPAEPK